MRYVNLGLTFYLHSLTFEPSSLSNSGHFWQLLEQFEARELCLLRCAPVKGFKSTREIRALPSWNYNVRPVEGRRAWQSKHQSKYSDTTSIQTINIQV